MGGMISLELIASLAEGRFAEAFPDTRDRRVLSVSLMVTQAAGALKTLMGLPPITKQGITLISPLASARQRERAGVSIAFRPSWFYGQARDKFGALLLNEEGKPMSNASVMAARSNLAEKAKQEAGFTGQSMSWAGVLGQLTAVTTHHVSRERLARVAQLDTPVLVVSCTHDNLVRPRNQYVLAKGPLAPVVFEHLHLEDTAHVVIYEREHEVNAAISRVINEAETNAKLTPSGVSMARL
jgi:pimeloyl-ACP methyl ester carboxylesterase